ncbi:MAG: hypothetical protein ACRDKY_11895 [Solirubrobacteraceae bacterium]
MSVFTRFREWATIQKLGSVADLLFKFTALVAALAAANFFYFQPDVKLTTTAQAFIDEGALSQAYAAAAEPMPPVVEEVVGEYNRLNAIDLRTGRNSTAGKLPSAELCERMPQRIEQIYPKADCAATRVVLGRGRYYERLLLDLNDRAERDMGPQRMREAIARIYRAEYRRARCWLKNDGSAKAENVRIRISEGFAPRARSRADNAAAAGSNDAFFLHEGKGTFRLFETARGEYEPQPSLEFDVDWDRADLADSGVIPWLVIFLLAAFVLVVINDVTAALRTTRDGERSRD